MRQGVGEQDGQPGRRGCEWQPGCCRALPARLELVALLALARARHWISDAPRHAAACLMRRCKLLATVGGLLDSSARQVKNFNNSGKPVATKVRCWAGWAAGAAGVLRRVWVVAGWDAQVGGRRVAAPPPRALACLPGPPSSLLCPRTPRPACPHRT